jgi:hypothetical protein
MAVIRLIGPSGFGLRPLSRASGFELRASGRIGAVLALLLALALAACRSSEAGSGSGLTPPPGWTALPALATAASDAAKAGRISVDAVEAWGEPARGCYATWIALRGGGGAADVMATELVNSVRAEPALVGIVVRDVVKPAAGAKIGVLSLTFERGIYRGKLRATLGSDGKLAALACFWNLREPIACEQACTGLLGSMR